MKNLLLLFLLVATFSVSAQTERVPEAKNARTITATGNMNERLFDGTESLEGRAVRKSIHQIYAEQGAQPNGLNAEEWIGTTYYDLQTNGSGQNRYQADDIENLRVVWTHHGQTEDGAFPDRGTGFNETVNSLVFPPDDDLKLEAPRTGWPNIVTLADGTDIVVNHLPADINELVMLRRAPGTTDWVESRIPTTAPFGLLWPQIAVSGNTLHMICVSTPTGNGGEPFQDLDPALLYFRSSDGGLTFEISDRIIEGLGAPVPTTTEDLNGGIGGDSYQLVADEAGNVAIGIFDAGEDIRLVKSEDNGESFLVTTISALPFDDYTFSTIPYTVEDLGGIDPNGPGFGDPDSLSAAALSFLTSDGSGAIALDSEGDAHVVFPQMYVSAADTSQAAGAFTFFPFFGNLIYWNECDGTLNRLDQVVNALDTNGDTTLNFASIDDLANHNGNMFISMPSLEILDNGNIILAYTGAMEELIRDDATNVEPIQHYTHVWMTGSSDAGETWADPVDIISDEFALFGFLVNTTDAVFPNMHVASGNQVALTYQFDDEPGLNLVAAEEDPITANTITSITIDVESVLGLPGDAVICALTNTTVVDPANFKFDVSPNPAAGLTTINFEIERTEDVKIELYNVVGSLVSQVELDNISAGTYTQNLNLANVSAGVYMVSLRAGDEVATQKLVVTK